jgi:hypothetical protein
MYSANVTNWPSRHFRIVEQWLAARTVFWTIAGLAGLIGFYLGLVNLPEILQAVKSLRC